VATARTRTNKVVHVAGDFPPGQLMRVAVEYAAPSHLIGRIVP
jgi:tRNA A37 methylthiotransferase MiaB